MRFALVPLITSLALACRTTPALSGDAALVSPPATSAIDYRALVGAADRSDDDRALDPQRKPVEFLEFLQVRPGMRVAELIAGFGYTTELLARAVGEGGVVYAQNNRFVLERFAEAGWAARLATPAMKPVVRVDRELDDPLPLEARDLDLVVIMLFYHDTYWQGADRDRMNSAVRAALRPGGRYVVIDHSALPGHADRDVETLHRVEESLVRAEIERAGFRLVAEGSFLREPGDTRDWNAAPRAATRLGRRGSSDRFVLAFEPAPGGASP